MATARTFEWPTVLMMVGAYAVWAAGTSFWDVSGLLSVVLTGVAVAQFSSLQHEVLHGHPFENQWLNEALVFPAFAICLPYLRFKDTHLIHHYDPNLTDPYDDPEANYMDPKVWEATSRPMRKLLRWNNTLLGRMLLGPMIGTIAFIRGDWALIRAGDARVRLAWVLNFVGFVPVLAWLIWQGMPIWAYVVSVYFGAALLKIRTYLEHRAHEACRARTVVIESRGPLSYLFLNNNFHVVHHTHPSVPWYKLPAMYAARKEYYLRRNEAYAYTGYRKIFAQYLLKAKDPVPHPIWPVKKSEPSDTF